MAELLIACERTPQPNTLFCKIADDVLGRGGRLHMVAHAQNERPEPSAYEMGRSARDVEAGRY